MSFFNNHYYDGGIMKQHYIRNTFAVCLIGLLCLSVAIAQPMDHPLPPHGGPMSSMRMVKELNLTDEQATKIQKIFEAQREEMKKMFEAAEEEREAMHEKMDKQFEKTNAKISAVLTEEQKEKFKKIQKERSQRPPHMPGPEDDLPMEGF
jgi:Spy/CpxP family protein refolding chaperone